MEFEEKPVFPPPLIILSHIHRTFKYFYYRNWKRKPFIYGHGLKRFLAGENLERVHDFEEECVDMYMREKVQKVNQSTEVSLEILFPLLKKAVSYYRVKNIRSNANLHMAHRHPPKLKLC